MQKKFIIEIPVERLDSQISTNCKVLIENKIFKIEIRFNQYEIPITEIMGSLPIEDYAYQKAMFENSENCLLEIPITLDLDTHKISIPKKLKLLNVNPDFAGSMPNYKFASKEYANLFKWCISQNFKFIKPKNDNPLKNKETELYIVKALSQDGKISIYKTYLSYLTTKNEPIEQ